MCDSPPRSGVHLKEGPPNIPDLRFLPGRPGLGVGPLLIAICCKVPMWSYQKAISLCWNIAILFVATDWFHLVQITPSSSGHPFGITLVKSGDAKKDQSSKRQTFLTILAHQAANILQLLMFHCTKDQLSSHLQLFITQRQTSLAEAHGKGSVLGNSVLKSISRTWDGNSLNILSKWQQNALKVKENSRDISFFFGFYSLFFDFSFLPACSVAWHHNFSLAWASVEASAAMEACHRCVWPLCES